MSVAIFRKIDLLREGRVIQIESNLASLGGQERSTVGSAAFLDRLGSDDETRVVGCVSGLAMNVADVTSVGVIGG